MKSTKKQAEKEMTAEDFEALPARQRNRIIAELDAETPGSRLARSRPMNARERADWKEIQKNLRAAARGRGRPKVGAGVAKVSLSVERALLDRADAYAKTHNLNRSQLVARSLASFIGAA